MTDGDGRIAFDQSERDVAFVALEGEHDAYTTRRLEDRLPAMLQEGLAVVVDLSRASFIDSTVVAMLLRAEREANERGSRFLLLMDEQTGPAVRRLFEMSHLTSLFEIASTRAAALEAVHPTSAAA